MKDIKYVSTFTIFKKIWINPLFGMVYSKAYLKHYPSSDLLKMTGFLIEFKFMKFTDLTPYILVCIN